MTLEGAINFSESNDSNIYTMNSPQTGQYCVVIPKNIDGTLSMFVDINMKSLFDSLINNTITKDQLVEKINEEYKYVRNSYSSGILVLPMLDKALLEGAIGSGDKQKMFDETKKIGGITSEIYRKLTDSGIDKSKINQKIMMIEVGEYDTKFVDWLKSQMPNFVEGVSLANLKAKCDSVSSAVVNPFADVNPFTGESSDVGGASAVGKSTTNNSIFGAPQETTSVNSTPVEEVKNPQNQTIPSDIFGSSPSTSITDNNIAGTSVSEPQVSQNTSKPQISQSEIEPQPVHNVSLGDLPVVEARPAQSTVTPNPAPVINDIQESTPNDIDKKSGGFVNLLILLVILVVVTVISIEFGKFLFNTFGT